MIVIDYVIGVYTKMVRKLGIGNHNLVVKYYAALPPVKAFVKSKAVSGAQQERAHSPLQSFFSGARSLFDASDVRRGLI